MTSEQFKKLLVEEIEATGVYLKPPPGFFEGDLDAQTGHLARMYTLAAHQVAVLQGMSLAPKVAILQVAAYYGSMLIAGLRRAGMSQAEVDECLQSLSGGDDGVQEPSVVDAGGGSAESPINQVGESTEGGEGPSNSVEGSQ